MKKVILSNLYFLVNLFSLQAQTLYGTTYNGGEEKAGTINSFVPSTNTLTVLHSFQSIVSGLYHTNFVKANDGKLYSMSSAGGKDNAGVLFSFDPFSLTYKKLLDFDSSNGAGPMGALLQAADGKLYGTASAGGAHHAGVIFSYDPSSSTYKKLLDLDSSNGATPYGGFIQAADGKLYGTTTAGGNNGQGVIFSYDPSSSIYVKLYDFDLINGGFPVGNLVEAPNGKLYGMTQRGGNKSFSLLGVLFSYDPSSFIYTKLKEFDASSGTSPTGTLLLASDGKLYGMTNNGGGKGNGVLFSYSPLSSAYAIIKEFDNNDGTQLTGSLIQASDKKIYGTKSGGSHSVGIIFSLDPSSSIYTKLMDFKISTGGYPIGSLTQASDGKFYGMTHGLFDRSYGSVIFSYDPSSFTYKKLKDFGSNELGSNVLGGLIKATDNKFYGVTNNGGANSVGAIFSFDRSSLKYTKLKDFDDKVDGKPSGSLIQARDGKLYGMSTEGNSGVGSIFSYDPISLTFTKRREFVYPDGYPSGSFLLASDGKLYGMSTYGGSTGGGFIFSFDPVSSVYMKLKDFDDDKGIQPSGTLIQATDGKLYGTANYGGLGFGVIFSFDPSSLTYTKLFDFDFYTNGADPVGGLVQASDGKLYGTTTRGATGEYGFIFSFDPSSLIFKNLKKFEYDDGIASFRSRMQASDGKLYGMTNSGGSNDLGVIFSFDPINSTYTKLKDYDGANGANPFIGSAFTEVAESSINKPPTISLTKPTHDTTYIALARIKINAAASDGDGTITKVEFYNGATLLHTETEAPYDCIIDSADIGIYSITVKAYDNDGNVATSNPVNITVVPNTLPTVAIKTPFDGASYPAPVNIILTAIANDVDGRIIKLEFYNGSILLFTETAAPYERKWFHLKVGSYTITAKAYDNKGGVTTSAPVNFSVVPDKAPLVSITSPANGTNFTAPANIELTVDASDIDGTIKTVDFYNGSTLLFTEKYLPYSNTWANVLEGNYSITAVATDNNGKTTTSAPVTISVAESGRPIASRGKLNLLNQSLNLKVNPNPVAKVLNISIDGLQANRQPAISILSASGALIKTIQSNVLNKNIQLNVSSLSAGVYFIKVISGDKILYKQFVKM